MCSAVYLSFSSHFFCLLNSFFSSSILYPFSLLLSFLFFPCHCPFLSFALSPFLLFLYHFNFSSFILFSCLVFCFNFSSFPPSFSSPPLLFSFHLISSLFIFSHLFLRLFFPAFIRLYPSYPVLSLIVFSSSSSLYSAIFSPPHLFSPFLHFFSSPISLCSLFFFPPFSSSTTQP